MTLDIDFRVRPVVTNEALNALFAASWPDHTDRDLTQSLTCSLTYICAFRDERLVGFVNVAWDGDKHAFLLNPTVHPNARHQGVGSELVHRASSVARARGAEWLHVDYAPALEPFYRQCGFQHTEAGLMRLQTDNHDPTVERSEHFPGQSSVALLHMTAQSRTLECRRCHDKTIHTWKQWRPWYLALSPRRWQEGWVCEQCGAHRFVWRIKRGQRY